MKSEPNPASSASPNHGNLQRALQTAIIVGGMGMLVSGGFVLGSQLYIAHVRQQDFSVAVKSLGPILQANTKASLALIVKDKRIVIPATEMQSWIESYVRSYTDQEDLRLNSEKMQKYLASISASVSVKPQNGRLSMKDDQLVMLTAGTPGKTLDTNGTSLAIGQAILEGAASTAAAISEVEPDITLAKVEALGISTLIATGESNFVGSSTARVHNIRVGSAKYNGLVLQPKEEFSFNTILGEVEASTGYAAEKVIKTNKLVYEYGGGLCQVSTTVFRVAIFAGFPILERRPHSFPVRYYNPQGFDATIYPGSSDLRFTNDTDSPVLFQAWIEGTKLFVQVYGAPAGRTATIAGPYQYDQQADGSMKAYFIRKIVYDSGGSKEQTFSSNYSSPALYPLEQRNPLE